MRNKKLLWILGIVILAVNSLVVTALSNPFSWISSRLSGGVGILAVVVNTVIIALLLYFAVTVFKLLEFPKAGTARTVFVIVLLLLSLYLSVGISKTSAGNYEFIWSKPVVSEVKDYLFSSGEGGKSVGILRPSRILIFTGAALIFSWFFIGFLKIGGGNNNRFDTALAVLIAAEATRAGMSKGMLIFVGQIIALFMFYRQFQKEEKRHWLVAFTWGYVIQSLVVSILFKPEDRIWASWLLTMVRIPHSAVGLIWLVIGIFAILPIIVSVGLFASKKNKEAKDKENLLGKCISHISSSIKDIMNKIPYLAKHVEQRYSTPEGQFPFMFRKLRVELITHMNYLLRLQVYHSKRIAVERVQADSEKVFRTTSQTRAGGSIKTNAFDYKVGRKIGQLTQEKPTWEGNIVPDSTWCRFGWYYDSISDVGNRTSRPASEYGWAKMKYAIHELMQQFKFVLENVNGLVDPSHQTDLQVHIERGKSEVIEHYFAQTAESRRRFVGHFNRYGAMQIPHALSWQMMDQNNIGRSGWFKHNYRFARSKALPLCIPAKFDNHGNLTEDKSRKPVYYKEPVGNVEEGEYGQDTKLWEIDSRGRFVYDIAILEHVTLKNPSQLPEFIEKDKKKIDGTLERGKMYYRQVFPEDAWNMVSVEEICSSVIKDWWLFTKDFQGGKSHPFSKVVSGYLQCIENGKFDFAKHYKEYIEEGKTTPGDSNPAFDREALKDPGEFQFRGKKLYFENEVEGEPLNDYPCISLLGLNDYIRAMVKRLTFEEDLVEKHLTDYTWIAKGEKKMFTRYVKEGEKK